MILDSGHNLVSELLCVQRWFKREVLFVLLNSRRMAPRGRNCRAHRQLVGGGAMGLVCVSFSLDCLIQPLN